MKILIILLIVFYTLDSYGICLKDLKIKFKSGMPYWYENPVNNLIKGLEFKVFEKSFLKLDCSISYSSLDNDRIVDSSNNNTFQELIVYEDILNNEIPEGYNGVILRNNIQTYIYLDIPKNKRFIGIGSEIKLFEIPNIKYSLPYSDRRANNLRKYLKKNGNYKNLVFSKSVEKRLKMLLNNTVDLINEDILQIQYILHKKKSSIKIKYIQKLIKKTPVYLIYSKNSSYKQQLNLLVNGLLSSSEMKKIYRKQIKSDLPRLKEKLIQQIIPTDI